MQFQTVQEACDYAVKKIVEQGGRCMAGRDCAYADGKGNHCAIGWLLPENTSQEVWDYVGDVEGLIVQRAPDLPEVVEKNLGTFKRLQDFHDLPAKVSRVSVRRTLREVHGINTSGEHWQQWIDMGR